MTTYTSSLLQTIILVMGTYTYYTRNLNHWTYSKIYKAEVENQLNRKIKSVRSDRDDKYYGRYDRSGRCPELFANF